LPPSPPTDRLTPEQQVCFALSVADRRVVAFYRPMLEPLGLTHPQYLLMIALWQHAPVPTRQLGRLLALDSGTLSPLLTRLEAAGLVVRMRGSDERSVTVDLTEQGRDLRKRARSVPDGVIDRLGLDVSELTVLQERLMVLIAAANALPS
jgi:MarR family transcriptional regulator, organic hydroperoxide resistance regulator